jgi:UDP-perosamine 4-acetyltransferase
VILGAGGHGRVVLDALIAARRNVLGLTDARIERRGERIRGVPVIGSDDEILAMKGSDVELTVGVGSVGTMEPRANLFDRYRDDFVFARVVHPSAILAPDVTLADGCQVMAGAVLQTGASIGKNSIVNTRAGIDHDCVIGDHVHVAPGVTISGGVTIGDKTHIGAGATIIQGVAIGSGCVIAAGAVVIEDVADGTTFIPGRQRHVSPGTANT